MGLWTWLRTRRPRDVAPEAAHRVLVDDERIHCEHPDGTLEVVSWSGVRRVSIRVTSWGPAGIDYWWSIEAEGDSCTVPLGADGESALRERIRGLEGFRDDAIAQAMARPSDREVVCWERPA